MTFKIFAICTAIAHENHYIINYAPCGTPYLDREPVNMSPRELRPFIIPGGPESSASLLVDFRRLLLFSVAADDEENIRPSSCLLSSCLSSRLFQVSPPLFILSLLLLFLSPPTAESSTAPTWQELYGAENKVSKEVNSKKKREKDATRSIKILHDVRNNIRKQTAATAANHAWAI